MYEKHKGHLVGLFRQPEQRLLSAYYDDDDLFRAFPDYIPVCSTETMTQEMPMEVFIQKWARYETGQLVGKLDLTAADVPKAIERLEHGFAFVGLQEEWDPQWLGGRAGSSRLRQGQGDLRTGSAEVWDLP
ncbi:unnamed protein product [Durusdinium trenchii]|uniref:Uncharacterized protein n=1 Tax=Durusdinium trenchii TaxID=1381693 RepID=A0ABP0MGU9_9DINO